MNTQEKVQQSREKYIRSVEEARHNLDEASNSNAKISGIHESVKGDLDTPTAEFVQQTEDDNLSDYDEYMDRLDELDSTQRDIDYDKNQMDLQFGFFLSEKQERDSINAALIESNSMSQSQIDECSAGKQERDMSEALFISAYLKSSASLQEYKDAIKEFEEENQQQSNNTDSDNRGEASNRGSLIDDFADPNLDQPSHMDPED